MFTKNPNIESLHRPLRVENLPSHIQNSTPPGCRSRHVDKISQLIDRDGTVTVMDVVCDHGQRCPDRTCSLSRRTSLIKLP